METLPGMMLLMLMYFNYYVYLSWVLCNGLFLYFKMDIIKIPLLLVGTIYILVTGIFSVKIHLVQRRDFIYDIQKLTWFALMTFLLQLPLLCFFLVTAESQVYTPVELCLHGFIFVVTLIEGTFSFISVVEAVHHVMKQCPHPMLMDTYAGQFPPIGVQRVYDTNTKVPRPARICRPRVHTNLLTRHSFRMTTRH